MTAIHQSRFTAGALALAIFASIPAGFAQQPAPDPQQPAPAPETRVAEPETRAAEPQSSLIEGDLLSVDATAKTLVVKTEDGKEEQLRYTDTTVITGADRGLAGLANTDGTRVTVRFDGEGDERVATQIAVHPKQ